MPKLTIHTKYTRALAKAEDALKTALAIALDHDTDNFEGINNAHDLVVKAIAAVEATDAPIGGGKPSKPRTPKAPKPTSVEPIEPVTVGSTVELLPELRTTSYAALGDEHFTQPWVVQELVGNAAKFILPNGQPGYLPIGHLRVVKQVEA